MADLGIVASIIQIADIGLRLSLRLYAFGKTAASADNSIRSISKDVSLTSSVLQELGHVLEKDKEKQVCSMNAIKTADDIVQECLGVFQEVEGALDRGAWRSISGDPAKGKKSLPLIKRFTWPFVQPKVQLLTCHLDKLKVTLMLMLNVLTYARQVAEKYGSLASILHSSCHRLRCPRRLHIYRKQPELQLESHRRLIEDLARSKDEYTRKFESLTLAIEKATSNKHKSVMSNAATRSPEIVANEVLDEMSRYSDLINHIVHEINTAEEFLEQHLGRRIREDVVNTHRRESDRLKTLYGINTLQNTVTGFAWDVLTEALKEVDREQMLIGKEIRDLFALYNR